MDIVCTNSEYTAQMVFQVWDSYRAKLGLKYLDPTNCVTDSLKDTAILVKDMVKDTRPTFHKNHLGFSVSLCKCVNFSMESVEKTLGVAISQFKDSPLQNHQIVFPYQINELQVVLGVLRLQITHRDFIAGEISIYSPIPDSNQNRVSNTIFAKVQALLQTISSGWKLEHSQSLHELAQQSDCVSCGAITAENGKFFLQSGKNFCVKSQIPCNLIVW